MDHPFSLAGRVALVAGASRGLGFEIARGLGKAGAAVTIGARDAASLSTAAERLRADGIDARAALLDIADAAATAASVAALAAARGRLDILVDAAGLRRRAAFPDLTAEDLRAMTDVTIAGAFALAQAALPAMQRQGRGRLIFLTSIAGPVARAGDAAYTAAKAGLAGLVKALAVEYGPHGVTANAIAPGFFATAANRDLMADPAIEAFLAQRCPLRRWGAPEEIAGAAVFLASDAASYVNGHVLTVDGGLTASF